MKKSTVLVLFIVFVGSVLVVGLFGMRSVPVEERIPIEDIYINSITTDLTNPKFQGELISKVGDNENGEKEIYLPFEENMTVWVGFRINPADATDKNVEISILFPNDYDPNAPDNFFSMDERYGLTFYAVGSVRLRFRATDQAANNAVTDLWINVVPEKYLP